LKQGCLKKEEVNGKFNKRIKKNITQKINIQYLKEIIYTIFTDDLKNRGNRHQKLKTIGISAHPTYLCYGIHLIIQAFLNKSNTLLSPVSIMA
jgi:hypothetical protein